MFYDFMKLFITFKIILKVEGETVKVSKQEYSFEFLTVSFWLKSNDKYSSHILFISKFIACFSVY